MGSDLDRPILNDGDYDILVTYESHREIDDMETLAAYVRALARMTVAVSRDDSYHMGDIQRMVGVANDLERGEYATTEIHEWLEQLSVPDGVEPPETGEVDSDE